MHTPCICILQENARSPHPPPCGIRRMYIHTACTAQGGAGSLARSPLRRLLFSTPKTRFEWERSRHTVTCTRTPACELHTGCGCTAYLTPCCKIRYTPYHGRHAARYAAYQHSGAYRVCLPVRSAAYLVARLPAGDRLHADATDRILRGWARQQAQVRGTARVCVARCPEREGGPGTAQRGACLPPIPAASTCRGRVGPCARIPEARGRSKCGCGE
jgi:hypothetical protein